MVYIIKPEYVYAFVGFIATIVGMWNAFSSKITAQENRSTMLEKDIENLKEFKESANHRLDSHDEQLKTLWKEKVDTRTKELNS